MSRVLAWFSAGAASAVAAKLAVEARGDDVEVVYCDTSVNEHPDNPRFVADVERWIGRPIRRLYSEKYATVDDVISRRRYMSGVQGALCTVELKKLPRFAFQRADDVHVFGLTADERPRIDRFRANNPELDLWWVLVDAGLTKDDCLARLTAAGIPLPTMYALGYRNNNCLGCVKATSAAYWNKIRHDFPDVFARRVAQSRELNVQLTRWRGRRIFLDELPDAPTPGRVRENISCGPECGLPQRQESPMPKTVPAQKPHRSKQDVCTPPAFLDAVKALLLIDAFTVDLAATDANTVAEMYFTPAEDALRQSWDWGGWNWLNPEFGDIEPWVTRAWQFAPVARTAVLVPSSTGSHWWARYVHQKAKVVFVRPRVTFIGHADPYPKDLALLLYGPAPTTLLSTFPAYTLWDWKTGALGPLTD